MRYRALLAVLASVAIPACAAAPAFTDQDAAAVTAVFDSTVARIRAGQWDAWAAEFSDSARFHAPNGSPVIGRAAILEWGRAMPPVEQFSFHDVYVAGEGNLAWGTSGYVMKLRDMPADSGKQLVVFRRTAAGTWEVIAGSFSSNLPLPAPPVPTRR